MNRQRNNLAKLPFAIREKVCSLLFDGAGYAEIRKMVAAADPKARIHNTTLLAYAKSAEYREYQEQRRQWSARLEKRRWAAGVVNRSGGVSSVADLAALAITEQLQQLADGGLLETGKDVATVARAIATMQRTEMLRRQEGHDAEMAALKTAHADEIAARDAEIAGLKKEIELLKNNGKAVDGDAVADKLDEALGVRKG